LTGFNLKITFELGNPFIEIGYTTSYYDQYERSINEKLIILNSIDIIIKISNEIRD